MESNEGCHSREATTFINCTLNLNKVGKLLRIIFKLDSFDYPGVNFITFSRIAAVLLFALLSYSLYEYLRVEIK